MDVLKRTLRLCALAMVLTPPAEFTAQAAPPLDLSNTEGRSGGVPRERALTENDLVYTDVGQSSASPDAEFASMQLSVPARSLPHRRGKILFALRAGERVKPLKFSKDQRWVAVGVLSTRRRGWVPANAVKMPLKGGLRKEVPRTSPRGRTAPGS